MLCGVERARLSQEYVRTSLAPCGLLLSRISLRPATRRLGPRPICVTRPGVLSLPRRGHLGQGSAAARRAVPRRPRRCVTTPRCCRSRARARAACFDMPWIALAFHPLGGARARRSTHTIGCLQCGQTGGGKGRLTSAAGRFHASNDSIRARRALAAALSQPKERTR